MKIRSGFVSNSSSSSFVLPLRKLTPEQVVKILNHQKWGTKLGIEYANEPWQITIGKGVLQGDTSMDNFDMGSFLRRIGVVAEPQWSMWGDELDDDICDSEDCDSCVMRFLCYTNEW